MPVATKAVLMEEIASPTEVAAEQLRGADVCGLADFTPAQVRAVLDAAHEVKARPERYFHALERKQMVLFFEKASLRTRLTFEVAINTLGGNALFVDQTGQRLGERESLTDVSHNIERWMDVAVLRTFAHSTVTEVARHANIPVINALSEVEHPCQALADLLTLEEHLGALSGRRIAFVGDGNNVATSLMLGAAHTGMHFTLACPNGYCAPPEMLARAQEICADTGGSTTITHDAGKGVRDAEAVYTDTWVSMGHESEAAERMKVFGPFRVTAALMRAAAAGAIFMHCLPAEREAEVTAEVLDSAQSVVFDQAENRLHAQKALLLLLLGASVSARPRAGKFPQRSSRG